MAIKFFGQYLLDRGRVTREGLVRAVQLQDRANLGFGATALAMKLMREGELMRVRHAQLTEDLRFGEMAERLGFLDRRQVEQVLREQRRTHVRIGEALVRVGALGAEELEQLLEEFRIDQALYLTSDTAIPPGVLHPEVWEFCVDLTAKMLWRVTGVRCRVGECAQVTRLAHRGFAAAIPLAGGVSATFCLAVSDPLRDRIARAILLEQEVGDEPVEVLEDAVMELANIVCGNVAARASQYGKKVEVLPPFALRPEGEGIAVPPGTRGLSFPVRTADGEAAGLALFVKG